MLFDALLRKWSNDLSTMARGLKVELDQQFAEVAREAVEGGLEHGRSLGGVAAHVANLGSIRATRNAITWDARSRRRGPTLGAEFGGGAHGKGNPTAAGGYTTQFRPHRGQQGYMVYRWLRENDRKIDKRYNNGVGEIARPAFPN